MKAKFLHFTQTGKLSTAVECDKQVQLIPREMIKKKKLYKKTFKNIIDEANGILKKKFM